MLDQPRIDKIVAGVAKAKLGSASVERVITESATDSEGRDAIRITIVLKPGAVAKVSGDQALDTLFQIQQGLQRTGEQRFAFVEYATQAELDEIGDPQS